MKFHFYNPQKALLCAEPRRFDILSIKINAGVSPVGNWKNQKKVVNIG